MGWDNFENHRGRRGGGARDWVVVVVAGKTAYFVTFVKEAESIWCMDVKQSVAWGLCVYLRASAVHFLLFSCFESLSLSF